MSLRSRPRDMSVYRICPMRMALLSLVFIQVSACRPAEKAQSFSIHAEPSVNTIPLNQLHDWIVNVSGVPDVALREAEIQFDARMPEHGHGMSTSPIVQGKDQGSYLVRGVRFNMPGKWVVTVSATVEGRSYHFDKSFEL